MDITKDNKVFFRIPDIIPTINNRYEVLENIGTGGNSSVYECIDNFGEIYAIKFQLNLSWKCKKRFEQEIKVLKSIEHPNLIRYIDDGIVKGEQQGSENVSIPFMIMEKADRNLKEYISEHGSIIYSEYISQFLGLSEALASLHEQAIHRDIKLENILIIGQKWVLSDLGLCTFLSEEDHEDLTYVGEKIGPKYWMSPEALNKIYNKDEKIISSSDVFQLAAIFWFVGTNRFPLGIVSEVDWKNDDLEICKVILKGLSHDYRCRQNDGKELHMELEKVVDKYHSI